MGGLRISLFMGNAILDTFDLASTEAGGSTLVFGSGEAGAHRTLELRDWGTGGGSPRSPLGCHSWEELRV